MSAQAPVPQGNDPVVTPSSDLTGSSRKQQLFAQLRQTWTSGPLAQALPKAIDQATDTLNPPHAVSVSTKETSEQGFNVLKPSFEAPGLQTVEQEVSHELPPEVESYLQKVESHHDQLPQEVVVTDPSALQSTPHLVAAPVIVLPITADQEKKAAWKSPKFSIRWLVEFSWKVMKMFAGKVVYRPA